MTVTKGLENISARFKDGEDLVIHGAEVTENSYNRILEIEIHGDERTPDAEWDYVTIPYENLIMWRVWGSGS